MTNRLIHYLEIAKSGDKIVVTDRGVPVAILHGLDQVEEKPSIEERLAGLSQKGLLKLPRKPMAFSPVTRIKSKGEPLSETVIKERRSGVCCCGYGLA